MFPYNGPLTTTVGYRYFGAEVHVRSCMPHAFAQRHIASNTYVVENLVYLLYAFVQWHEDYMRAHVVQHQSTGTPQSRYADHYMETHTVPLLAMERAARVSTIPDTQLPTSLSNSLTLALHVVSFIPSSLFVD